MAASVNKAGGGKASSKAGKPEKFSAEEREAMKEALKDKRRAKTKTSPEEDMATCLAAIDAMEPHDKALALHIHRIVGEVAPQLAPRTFYGMPAYYLNGNNVCFFQSGAKFKTRYSTLGFSQAAQLDNGEIWPSAYAILEFTPQVEQQVRQLIAKAASA